MMKEGEHQIERLADEALRQKYMFFGEGGDPYDGSYSEFFGSENAPPKKTKIKVSATALETGWSWKSGVLGKYTRTFNHSLIDC